MYVVPTNEANTSHLLVNHWQPSGETDEYLQVLKHLSGDCNYKVVNAEKCTEHIICNAFISSLISSVSSCWRAKYLILREPFMKLWKNLKRV